MAKTKDRLKIMVGSTVYGFEDQLSQIVAYLSNLGYKVLNSYHGSVKVNPHLSNLENCLNAVEECDLFLGIGLLLLKPSPLLLIRWEVTW